MLCASFCMYEVLWVVIEWQFNDISFYIEDTAWDLAQCAMFSCVGLIVNFVFTKWRGGRYARSLFELGTLLVTNALVTLVSDKLLFNGGEAYEVNFWSVIDIYIICVICTLFSIIDIQHFYYKEFAKMQKDRMLLRLNLLQQQLSPHFMFNSLSTLQGLIAAEPQKAEEYVATLSLTLRYITENIGKDKVPVADALVFIKSYTKMLGIRFPGHFVFNIDESHTHSHAFIVPVSLQIAVENAIKHNSHSCKRPLQISIVLGNGQIKIKNKLQTVAQTNGTGVGLKNLDERYRLLAGKGVEIETNKEYYTVKIPLIYESTNNRR